MSKDNIKTKVVGVLAVNEDGTSRQDIIKKYLAPRMLLDLLREPDNAYDPNAIAVFIKNKNLSSVDKSLKIGYLSSEIAEQLAPIIDDGEIYHCIVLDVTGGKNGMAYGVNIHLTTSVNKLGHVAADDSVLYEKYKTSKKNTQIVIISLVVILTCLFVCFGVNRQDSPKEKPKLSVEEYRNLEGAALLKCGVTQQAISTQLAMASDVSNVYSAAWKEDTQTLISRSISACSLLSRSDAPPEFETANKYMDQFVNQYAAALGDLSDGIKTMDNYQINKSMQEMDVAIGLFTLGRNELYKTLPGEANNSTLIPNVSQPQTNLTPLTLPTFSLKK